MTRYGMLINTKKCIGCYACRIACQNQNDLLVNESFIHYVERETGSYPNTAVETIPTQCMHCDDAPCASVCPTGATHITTEGVVAVDRDRCIGCRYCMAACPYQARVFNEVEGVADKCRLCTSATLEGKQVSSCVESCMTHARVFGDLDDPESEVSKAIVEYNALPLAGSLTKSKIYYVR